MSLDPVGEAEPAEQSASDGEEATDVDPFELDVLADWVNTFFRPVFVRPLKTSRWRWCPAWFEHPEAMIRLEACRRAHVALAGDPGTGLSVWLRDHADPMRRELMGEDGPFWGCRGDKDPYEHEMPKPAELPGADPRWIEGESLARDRER